MDPNHSPSKLELEFKNWYEVIIGKKEDDPHTIFTAWRAFLHGINYQKTQDYYSRTHGGDWPEDP